MTVSVGPFHAHVPWRFQQSVRLAWRLGKGSLCLHLASHGAVLTGNHVRVRLARLIRREKCHMAEINKHGRANFDSFAKVI